MTIAIQTPDKEENSRLHHFTLEIEIIQEKYAIELLNDFLYSVKFIYSRSTYFKDIKQWQKVS